MKTRCEVGSVLGGLAGDVKLHDDLARLGSEWSRTEEALRDELILLQRRVLQLEAAAATAAAERSALRVGAATATAEEIHSIVRETIDFLVLSVEVGLLSICLQPGTPPLPPFLLISLCDCLFACLSGRCIECGARVGRGVGAAASAAPDGGTQVGAERTWLAGRPTHGPRKRDATRPARVAEDAQSRCRPVIAVVAIAAHHGCGRWRWDRGRLNRRSFGEQRGH